MKETFLDIWRRAKFSIILVGAIAPVILVFSGTFIGDIRWFLNTTITILAFQVGLLIAVCYESQLFFSNSNQKTQGVHQIGANPIWKYIEGQKIKEIRILAINAGRFAKQIEENELHVSLLKVIAASDQAIETFCNSTFDEGSQSKCNALKMGLREFEKVIDILKHEKKIGRVEVARMETFPLMFFALFNRTQGIYGDYFPHPARDGGTGLRAVSWVETDKNRIDSSIVQFDRLFEKLYHQKKNLKHAL